MCAQGEEKADGEESECRDDQEDDDDEYAEAGDGKDDDDDDEDDQEGKDDGEGEDEDGQSGGLGQLSSSSEKDFTLPSVRSDFVEVPCCSLIDKARASW